MGRRTWAASDEFAAVSFWRRTVQVLFILSCFAATLALNLVWWFQLREAHSDQNNVLSSKAPNVVLASTCLIAVLSLVVSLRVWKEFRHMTAQSPFLRAIVMSHTSLAPVLSALVWYESLQSYDVLNEVYRARGYNNLVDVKMQTAALVLTTYTCKYVAAMIHTSHHKMAYPEQFARTSGSRPLMSGYDSYIAK